MNKKILKILLLVTLLILLIGITSATTLSNNTITTTTNKIVKENIDIQKNNQKTIEKNIITKKNKTYNMKKASTRTVNVDNFETFYETLNDDSYDTVTLNIRSDIFLKDNTQLNNAIRNLTINGIIIQ